MGKALSTKSRISATALILLVCALCLAPSAQALKQHAQTPAFSFGPDGTSGTEFNLLDEIGMSEATESLYGIDRVGAAFENLPAKIYGFDASTTGTYPPLTNWSPLVVEPSGAAPLLAVDNTELESAGNVYFGSSGTGGARKVTGYDSTGAKLPCFPIVVPKHGTFAANLMGLAVDPSGNIWLSNSKWLERYSPDCTQLDEIEVGTDGPRQLAFDSEDNLFVAKSAQIWRFPAPDYSNPTQFASGAARALTVDRSDDNLYVAKSSAIDRYDPEGNKVEEFATGVAGANYQGIAIDEASGDVYAADEAHKKIQVFGTVDVPTVATGAASEATETEATLNGTVKADGGAVTDCHFEYVTEAAFKATGFTDLSSGGSLPCVPPAGSIPIDGEKHAVSALATGLSSSTAYRFRLVASNANGTAPGKAVAFTLGLPGVETIGTAIRTATTARLDSRIYPHGIATEYRFQYLDDAAFASGGFSNPATEETPTLSTGGENLITLASAEVEGLQPNTTYHYRVVAENGNPAGPVIGDERTVTTRASDAALSHGHFPGPPGSDRAWEQVSLAESNGNPVSGSFGVSDNGNRALYQVLGGTPSSESGNAFSFLYSERTSSGWQTRSIVPPRVDAPYAAWRPPVTDDEITSMITVNTESTDKPAAGIWRLFPDGSPTKLYEAPAGTYGNISMASTDPGSTRALSVLKDSGVSQLYDVSSGSPQLADLLPNGEVPACGVKLGPLSFEFPNRAITPRAPHWVTADGKRAFFNTAGNSGGCSSTHLYMRDFEAGEEGETTLIDSPPLSGPDCGGAFIKSTADAAFFWTKSRLAADDVDAAGCGTSAADVDVYRYAFSDGSWDCVSCAFGVAADVEMSGANGQAFSSIAVAEDGSRVYFTTKTQLLPGTPESGEAAIYRVNVGSGEGAYVGPSDGKVGEDTEQGEALSADGRTLMFRAGDAELNALTGSNNGGSAQYYLYDDAARSLTCASCPADGSAPRGGVRTTVVATGGERVGPNLTPLADDGTFAFATPTPLVSADQNTAPAGEEARAGVDVYEWRDGQLFLVSDGLSDWPSELVTPQVAAVDPSGRDVFFTEAAQLTPDALDAYNRLYVARIGGGFDFPKPPVPCALEACQGTPKGAPEEAPPGSSSFQGQGNVKEPKAKPKPKKCAKGKHKVKKNGKTSCVKNKPKKKAKHKRRATR